MSHHRFNFFVLALATTCILCVWPASALLAQDSTQHPFFGLFNNAAGGSKILFAGETMDATVTALTETTENGVLVQKGFGNAQTISVSKWMVNGVQNGNSNYGTLVQKSTGYALYTAPSGGYYGPITLSATVQKSDGSEETAIAPQIYVVPKNLSYTACRAIGHKCPGVVSFLNSQGYRFDFHLERSSADQCNAVFDDGPTPIDGSPIKTHGGCIPSVEVDDWDFGQDMEMQNPRCEYHGSDNMLYFKFDANDLDAPGYTLKIAGTETVLGKVPVSKAPHGTWIPEANISSLPYTSPMTKSPPGGAIIIGKYIVRVVE